MRFEENSCKSKVAASRKNSVVDRSHECNIRSTNQCQLPVRYNYDAGKTKAEFGL